MFKSRSDARHPTNGLGSTSRLDSFGTKKETLVGEPGVWNGLRYRITDRLSERGK
jgi:hypothetical protein